MKPTMSTKLKAAALTAAFALTIGAAPAVAQDESPAASQAPLPTPVSEAPAAPGSELAYQGDISFWNTMRDFEFVHVQSLIDQWMTAHPGITVKHDLVPFDFGAVRTTKYLPAALNGTAPDIFRSDVAWTPGFADQGILADLTSYFTADELADFLPGPLGTTTYQGMTYAVPHVTDALGLMCNKQLLAEAGLDHAPATWDELVEAGKQVTDLDAQKYGFYTRGDSYWALPFIWSWGGGLLNVDENGNPSDILVNSPESVAGLEYLKNEILGVVAPATWDFQTDYDNMNAGFKAGTIMCILQGPWQAADILTGDAFKDDPSNLVIAPVPTGSDSNTGSPVGGHNFVVYTPVADNADKLAAVVDLLKFITSTEAQAYLAKNLGLLPTRVSAYADPSVSGDALVSQWNEVMSKATNRAGFVAAPDIFADFNREFQAFLLGDETAQQALDNVASAWQNLTTWTTS
jgi:arabinogalactan oligomer/maltooligosaccharide transport system substrate-binding protein